MVDLQGLVKLFRSGVAAVMLERGQQHHAGTGGFEADLTQSFNGWWHKRILHEMNTLQPNYPIEVRGACQAQKYAAFSHCIPLADGLKRKRWIDSK